MKNEVYAAIAMALYEFKGNNVHDKEPGIITICEKQTQCPDNDRSSLKRNYHEERI